ncbi:ABC transporter permease subunit [Leucobacter sp. W1478]|uniref:ABC transporter permease subunit n=1 Tax=Leucobacter sp. W1478 TaxID=3439065 RepID=UPI003F2B3290
MRNPLPLTTHALRHSARGLLVWAFAIAGVLFLYLPLYPSIGGASELQGIIDSLPPELIAALGYDQITTGAGYTQSTFFGLMGYVLTIIAATSWGSALIAGAWETGELELNLAHGVSRTRVALEAGLTLLVKIAVLLGVTGAVILALDGPAELGLESVNVAAALLGLGGLAFLSGAGALLGGALTGRRSIATGVGAGLAVLGFAFQAVARQSRELEWLQNLSPFHWAYDPYPLQEGFAQPGLPWLWALGAMAVVFTSVVLNRRDIT